VKYHVIVINRRQGVKGNVCSCWVGTVGAHITTVSSPTCHKPLVKLIDSVVENLLFQSISSSFIKLIRILSGPSFFMMLSLITCMI